MDYKREIFEMGGNPITKDDNLKAGILRDKESAMWCLQVCLREMETNDLHSLLRDYKNMLGQLDGVDIDALTHQEVCDLADTIQGIEITSTYLQSGFANLYSSFSDLEKYPQKRA